MPGWHICSSCEKAVHYMCYTCTYSLCKVCIKQGKFFSVRGTKGFCDTCYGTILLIESKDESAIKVNVINMFQFNLVLCYLPTYLFSMLVIHSLLFFWEINISHIICLSCPQAAVSCLAPNLIWSMPCTALYAQLTLSFSCYVSIAG